MLAPVSSLGRCRCILCARWLPRLPHQHVPEPDPFNYYCILTLVMVIVTSLLNIDYGPMLTHEYNAQVKDDLFTTPERPFAGADDYEEGAKHSSVLDLLLPVIVLIALCIVGLIWTGGMWDTESDNYRQLRHVLLRRRCRYRPVPGLHHGPGVHLRVLLAAWPHQL